MLMGLEDINLFFTTAQSESRRHPHKLYNVHAIIQT